MQAFYSGRAEVAHWDFERITNDYNNTRSYKFVDDFQNIITEYMKLRGYSVGISDLIADKDTNDSITKAITQKKIEVKFRKDMIL